MKSSISVHPFISLGHLSLGWVDDREPATPTPEPPRPPEARNDPGEPERQYPLWTCFIENPRLKS